MNARGLVGNYCALCTRCPFTYIVWSSFYTMYILHTSLYTIYFVAFLGNWSWGDRGTRHNARQSTIAWLLLATFSISLCHQTRFCYGHFSFFVCKFCLSIFCLIAMFYYNWKVFQIITKKSHVAMTYIKVFVVWRKWFHIFVFK